MKLCVSHAFLKEADLCGGVNMLVGEPLLSMTPKKSLIHTYLIECMPSKDQPLIDGERYLVFDQIEGGSYECDEECSSGISRIPHSPKATNEMR